MLTQLLIIGSPIAMAYLVIIRWSNRFSRVVLILGALAAGTAWFLLISGFQAIEHFSAAQNLPYAAPWLIFGALIRPYHEPSELDGSTETQSNTRAPSSQTLPQRIFRGFARTAADFVAATAIGVAITETVRFLTGAFDGPSPFPLIVTDALFLALFTIVGGGTVRCSDLGFGTLAPDWYSVPTRARRLWFRDRRVGVAAHAWRKFGAARARPEWPIRCHLGHIRGSGVTEDRSEEP